VTTKQIILAERGILTQQAPILRQGIPLRGDNLCSVKLTVTGSVFSRSNSAYRLQRLGKLLGGPPRHTGRVIKRGDICQTLEQAIGTAESNRIPTVNNDLVPNWNFCGARPINYASHGNRS
jgi:hypothetical protein